jgi:hypothetical protein
MGVADFLKEHDNNNTNNRNRPLALVLYLSPDWHPDFGNLHITIRSANGSSNRNTLLLARSTPWHGLLASLRPSAKRAATTAGNHRRVVPRRLEAR